NLGVRDADAVCATLALRPRWPGLALLATRAGLATLALRPALARWPLRAGRPGGPGLATLALRPALARWPLRAGRPGGSGLAFLAALRRRLLAQLGQELVADLDTHRPQARIHGVHEPLDGGEDAVAHAATFSCRARSVIACAIARSAASSSSSASSFGTVSGGVGGCIGFGVTIVSRRFSASSEKFCCCM